MFVARSGPQASYTQEQPAVVSFAPAVQDPLSVRAQALVFMDPASRLLQQRVQACATLSTPLLIQGGLGTGKELLARYAHTESSRSGLFVAVGCARLSRQQAAAELFGQAPGLPAGPSSRAGWLGSAQGGTLYLDELMDLAPLLQIRLAQVLLSGEVQREGESRSRPVDVRVIGASGVNLESAVARGKFDATLWELLQPGLLKLPGLHERPGDILPLAEYFMGVHCQRMRWRLPRLTAQASALLEAYAWPGNIRQLEQVVHDALALCGSEVTVEDLYAVGLQP